MFDGLGLTKGGRDCTHMRNPSQRDCRRSQIGLYQDLLTEESVLYDREIKYCSQTPDNRYAYSGKETRLGGRMLRVKLFGPMQVLGSDGRNLTPPSQKSRALLAMITTADGMRRSRTWLIDRLWSEKPLALGQTSLRQTLREIRKTFGDLADEVLIIDNFTVAFVPNAVVLEDFDGDLVSAADFLEGIDIGDPEFEEWLTLERSRFSRSAGAEPRARQAETERDVCRFALRIDFPVIQKDDGKARRVADTLIDGVVRLLAEDGFKDIQDRRLAASDASAAGPRPHRAAVAFRCAVRTDGEMASVSMMLIELGEERAVWSRSFIANGEAILRGRDTDSWVVSQNCAEAVWREKELAQRRERQGEDGADRVRAAVQDMFELGVSDLTRAEQDLRSLIPSRHGSLALAWLAFLNTFRIGQRYARHENAMHAEIRELSAKALERDPGNALVLALNGHTQSYVFGNFLRAVELFEAAIRVNPGRALAWDLYSVLHGYIGQPDAGLRCARYARYLGFHSPYRYYYNASCLITAGLSGSYREAIHYGEDAMAEKSGYITVLRHLTASYAHAGENEKAKETLKRLLHVEPGFSIDRLREAREPGLETLYGQNFLKGLRKAGVMEVGK